MSISKAKALSILKFLSEKPEDEIAFIYALCDKEPGLRFGTEWSRAESDLLGTEETLELLSQISWESKQSEIDDLVSACENERDGLLDRVNKFRKRAGVAWDE